LNSGSNLYVYDSGIISGTFKGSVTGSLGINGNVSITGSIVASGTSLVSGSSQIDITSTTNYTTFSSSVSSSIGNLSSSVATNTSGLAGRITTIEGRYATTGSNTFVGSQVITGSLYITNDMIVQGCSCLQNITASAVSIGTNVVMLNTATPAVRFAGISVQDSGSNAGVTGSIFWDGLCNKWIYSNPSEVGYSGGMLISGPRNTGTIGSEAPLTCNYIAKSGGGDHIYDSCIIDDGTTVCVNANLKGSGTLSATTIYGSTDVCSPVGKFTTCIDAGSGIFSSCVTATQFNVSTSGGATQIYNTGGGHTVITNVTANKDLNIQTSGTGGQYFNTAGADRLIIASTGAVTLSCQLYLDGCNRDTVFVKSNNNTFSRLFYAGQNSIVFHNGGTTACGGNWGLNNYEDTAALFRVFNNGTTNFYGRVCMCNLQILSIGSCCQGSIRLGGENGTGNSRLFFESNGNSSYIDNYGDSEYKKLSIETSCLILNGVSGGRVGIGTGTISSTLHILGLNDNQLKIDVAAGCSHSSINFARNNTNVGAIAYAHTSNEFQVPYTNCSCAYVAIYTGAGKVVTIDKSGFANFTCNIFAPGTPIQVVTGTAIATSGTSANNASLGPSGGGTTPGYNCGCLIATVSFTPKSASSKILIQTNNVVMWEAANVSDHFYLWASNDSAGTVLTKSGGYIANLGACTGIGTQGAIVNLNGAASSWGTSANTISFRIGTSGGPGNYYQWNPYYGAGGFNADTVGNFTYTIMEIAQ